MYISEIKALFHNKVKPRPPPSDIRNPSLIKCVQQCTFYIKMKYNWHWYYTTHEYVVLLPNIYMSCTFKYELLDLGYPT
jgi:hypothetical protein